MDLARFFEPVDVRDVGMVERREHLRLSLETRQAIRIVREQILDRDVAIEPQVARAIHLAHAARAELGDHFVGAKFGAGCQGHELGASQMIQRSFKLSTWPTST